MKKQYIEPEFEFFAIIFPGVLNDTVIHSSMERGGGTDFAYLRGDYDETFEDDGW